MNYSLNDESANISPNVEMLAEMTDNTRPSHRHIGAAGETELAALPVSLNPLVNAGWLLHVHPKPWLSNNKWIWIKKNTTLPEYKQTLQDIKCAEPLLSVAYTHTHKYLWCHRSRLCAQPLSHICMCESYDLLKSPRHLIQLFSRLGWPILFFYYYYLKSNLGSTPPLLTWLHSLKPTANSVKILTIAPPSGKKTISGTLKQLYIPPTSYFHVNFLAPLEKEVSTS